LLAGDFDEFGIGADFVVGAITLCADFSAGQELADETFADDDGFDRFAEGNFADVKLDAVFTPRHGKCTGKGGKRNFGAEFLKTFFVKFNSILIEADEQFFAFFFGSVVH